MSAARVTKAGKAFSGGAAAQGVMHAAALLPRSAGPEIFSERLRPQPIDKSRSAEIFCNFWKGMEAFGRYNDITC